MLQEKHVPKPWIKIIDFGLAQHLEDGVTFKSLCGTPQYIGMGLASPQGVPKQPCSVGCSWDALWGCSEGIPMVGKDPPPPRSAGREVAGMVLSPLMMSAFRLCVHPQLLK